MAIDSRMLRILSGPAALTGVGVYLIAYILLQYSGLFSVRPENIIRVLHLWPALAGSVACIVTALAGLMAGKYDADRQRAGTYTTLSRIMYLGILLFGAGVLLSSLTRFEGRVILADGQAVVLVPEAYDPGSLYARKYSRTPQGSLVAKDIAEFLSADKKPLARRSAQVMYRNDQMSKPAELRLHSFFPSLADGYFYRIRDIGYSPHVMLFDAKGSVIEDRYAIMQIFPPGVEDAFRFDQIIPHTFYLRYYPDVSLVPDGAAKSDIKIGPVFRIRIARNIDLLLERYAAPDDVISFDSLFLAVANVKKWVEIYIVRDPGIYLVIPGLFLVLFGSLSFILKRSITP